MTWLARFRRRRRAALKAAVTPQPLGPLIPVDPDHWTGGEILRAIRAWNAIHGEAPRYSEWHRGGAPGWPTARQVETRFGSWSKAIELAGLRPRPAHRPRKVALIVPRPAN